MKGVGDAEEVYEVKAIIDDNIFIGKDAGDISEEMVTGLILEKINEEDILKERWLKSHLLCESKCAGKEEKEQAYLKLVWSRDEEDNPVCLLRRAEDCYQKKKYTRAITYLKLILKDYAYNKHIKIMFIDICWKIIKLKSKLTSEYILIRDTADELLSNYPGTLSKEEKEKLNELIKAVGKKNK